MKIKEAGILRKYLVSVVFTYQSSSTWKSLKPELQKEILKIFTWGEGTEVTHRSDTGTHLAHQEEQQLKQWNVAQAKWAWGRRKKL